MPYGAQKVYTVLLKNSSLTALQTALAKLQATGSLTAGESGVAAIGPIANLTLVSEHPMMVWDGTNYVFSFFITSG